MKEIKYWETPEQQKEAFTYAYWNDVEHEKEKIFFWIESPSEIAKVENHLKSTGLLDEFELARNKFPSSFKGKVLDLACGVCWTVALTSKMKEIESIDALEFSLHRLKLVADHVIRGLKGDETKVQKIYGSFYNILSEPASYDLVLLSQAFHHADRPIHLLNEIDRVLKPGGSVILIGEHLFSPFVIFKQWIKHNLKALIKRDRKLTTDFYELFPTTDEIAGDHYYRVSDYRFLFRSMGYDLTYIKSNIRSSAIFCAKKRG